MSVQQVGNYEIVRLLARGGMAVVYLVRQPALDREVVLKRLDLDSDDPTLAQRFVHEARLAATLDHPNIVTLFDFFEHDGVPYIAMEYVAGGSLRSLDRPPRPAQVYGLVEGVLAGLGHAERRTDRASRPQAREPPADLRAATSRSPTSASPAPTTPSRRGSRWPGSRSAPGVHGPRAGHGRTAGSVHGPLRARGDRLRAPRGPPAVRRRHAGRRPVLPRAPPGAAARGARPRAAARPLRVGRVAAEQGRPRSGPSRPPRRGTRWRRSPSRSWAPTGGAG